VAILVADGFEQSELLDPRRALDHAGAPTFVVSINEDKVAGWSHDDWGNRIAVDVPLKSARPEDFHALLLPGGGKSLDQLCANADAVRFVRHFMEMGKAAAAIADGVRMILAANAVHGRIMTAPPSLQTDLQNAGANLLDKDLVCDGRLITCRKLEDIPAFNREMMRVFFEVREYSPQMRKIA
jgi:protease I